MAALFEIGVFGGTLDVSQDNQGGRVEAGRVETGHGRPVKDNPDTSDHTGPIAPVRSAEIP